MALNCTVQLLMSTAVNSLDSTACICRLCLCACYEVTCDEQSCWQTWPWMEMI